MTNVEQFVNFFWLNIFFLKTQASKRETHTDINNSSSSPLYMYFLVSLHLLRFNVMSS